MSEPDANARKPADPEETTAAEPDEVAAELVRVLDAYMAELQAGGKPDREKLMGEHPSLAGQLDQCLASIEFIHGASRPGSAAPVQLGDFRIVREIGRGGMGVVYEAEQVSLKRKVALKVLRFGGATDPEAMRRFQDEAETVARLHHTNIVPIFAVGCEQGVHYYAMQFIEGRGLDAVLEESRQRAEPLVSEDVAGWGLQAAEALVHAHQRGVIHRDIKPSNLLLDSDGTLWLTDFGLAKREDEITQTIAGVLMGTPRYMSPEQAAAVEKPLDHRTDIYSLGATLYELATGRPIFEADTPHAVITQILNSEPPAPRRLKPGLPRDLETMILKCISKEPSRRYATARELADDLRAFLDGRPIRARQPGPVERAVRWVRKHRRSTTVAGISASVAVLLVVGGILGWNAYRQSRLGQISLTTSGPQLLAEVFDENDEPVVPGFPVPTPEPVSLPAGSHRLRLSASGLLSETWPLDVQRGVGQSLDVRLGNRWLWPPKELNTNEYSEIEVADVSGRAGLIILSRRPGKNVARYVWVLRCVDGATGKSAWPDDLVLDEENLPAGHDLNEWRSLLSASGLIGEDRRLVQPPADLDGDGTRDLVWVSRESPSLLAISGAHGNVLWWFRALPRPPEVEDTVGWQSQGRRRGCVIGRATVADADADGVPDVIACFASRGETLVSPTGQRVKAPAQNWLEAVSGKTGKCLWRHSLAKQPFSVSHSSTTARWQNATCRPEVAQIGGRAVVVLIADTMLLGLVLKTGEDAWEPHDLGFRPLRAPHLADFDGDGQPEALLLHDEPQQQDTLRLTAVSLQERRTVWEKSFRPACEMGQLDRSIHDPYLVADLDDDGKPEVVVAVAHYWDQSNYRVYRMPWTGLEVFDGATGKPRWPQPRRLWMTEDTRTSVERFTVGPDLDGDGCRELFVAWPGYDSNDSGSVLLVAAFSGADGRTLWQWQRKGPSRSTISDPSGPLLWWQPGSDGWPMLVVPMAHGGGGAPGTFILSGGTGRLVHTLPGVYAPKVADFNGDGIADLFYTIAPQGARRMLVIGGTAAEPWRRLGEWRAGGDFDGDGFDDLLGLNVRPFQARSGRDGRTLWETNEYVSAQDLLLTPPLPHGDLNGDGTADLLRFHEVRDRATRQDIHTVSALSGKDGSLLWTAPDFGATGGGGSGSYRAWSAQWPFMDACDLDADGPAEVLVVHFYKNLSSLRLSVLSGGDGKLRLQVPIVQGSFALDASRKRNRFEDLDGDGVLDLVLWVPRPSAAGHQRPCELLAYSGRDGKPLWPSSPLTVAKDEGFLWPLPTVGDLDSDGTAEVMVICHEAYDRSRHGGYLCRLLVLDGRDGRQKWTWSWETGAPKALPPLLVDFRGDGRPDICLGVMENDQSQIAILDSVGEVHERIPLTLGGNNLEQAQPLWDAGDFDGDGREELLFLSDGKLHASGSGEDGLLWSWPLPEGPGQGEYHVSSPGTIVEVQPAAKDRPATVVVWAGRTIYGLAGPTGTPRWRCDVPWSFATGMSDPPTVDLLSTGHSQGLPRVVCHWRQYYSDYWCTVCRQAWPTRPTGQYRAPAGVPRKYGAEPDGSRLDDTLPTRPLPWTYMGPSDLFWGHTLEEIAIASGLASLLMAIVPGWLAWLTIRRRWWALGILLAAYAALAALGPYRQGVSTLVALVLPCVLLWRAVRRCSWGHFLLGVFYAVLILVPLLYLHRLSAGHMMEETHHWGRWWWLDELVGEPLLLSVIGLPGVVFWVLAIRSATHRRWAKLGLVAACSLVLAVALAILVLCLDARHLEPSQQYRLSGWYVIWFWGVYATGVLALLVLLARGAIRLAKRVLRKKPAQAPSA